MFRSSESARRRAAWICDSAIDAVGPNAPRLRILAEVQRRLTHEGLPSPSHPSLIARIAYRRSLADWEPGGGARLVIDLVRLHVPMLLDGEAIDPLLSLAILDPLRLIAGHLLQSGGTSSAALAGEMLDRIPIIRHAPAIVTRLPNVRSGGWPALRHLLAEAGVPLTEPTAASRRPGRECAMLVGRTLGGLPIGSGRRHATVLQHATTPIDQLEVIVEGAVARHNLSIGKRMPPFNLSRFSAADLTERLAASGASLRDAGRDRVVDG